MKVRIAVALNRHGKWGAVGKSGVAEAILQLSAVASVSDDENTETTSYWVEVDLPETPVVQGVAVAS